MLDLRRVPYDHPDAVLLTEQTQAYYVEIYGGPDRDPLTAEMMAPPTGGFFVGYAEGQPVAMGGWVFVDPPTAGARRAQIRRMFVSPAERRRGFGQQVLAAIEDDARRAGATEAVLSTGPVQVQAVALYRAAGYTDTEPFGYYGDKPTVICLAKPL